MQSLNSLRQEHKQVQEQLREQHKAAEQQHEKQLRAGIVEAIGQVLAVEPESEAFHVTLGDGSEATLAFSVLTVDESGALEPA